MELEQRPYFITWMQYLEESFKGQIGVDIVIKYLTQFATHFARMNDLTISCEKMYKMKIGEIMREKDGDKERSAAKVELLSEQTQEYTSWRQAKCDRENIEGFIDSLKSAQFGIKTEKSNFTNI